MYIVSKYNNAYLLFTVMGDTHRTVSSTLRIIANPTPFFESRTIKSDIIKVSFFWVGFPLNSLIFGKGGL